MMELFCFGMFAGIILALFFILILGVSKNDERNNKNTFYRDRSRNTNVSNLNRVDRCVDRNNKKLSSEEIIEDLIICDMLGIL